MASDLDLADLAEKDHASLDSVTAAQHHAATVAGDLNLADLAEKAHGSLSGVGSSDHHTGVGAIEGTVAKFQASTPSGTMGSPGNVNDNNPATQASSDTIGKYGDFDFGVVRALNQLRYYGAAGQIEDGEWKVQYWSLITHAWVDWVTGMATRLGSWSGWDSSGGEIITNKIRLWTIAVDTQGASVMGEMEVKYA